VSRAAAALLYLLALGAADPDAAVAQTGSGTTGAAVLQLPAGTRAAAMGGAYTAGADADALFYNPAAAAVLGSTASLSWQRHLDDIGFGTAAAAMQVGPAGIALTFGFLDYGSIAEVVPDPAYGDQRGSETGRAVDAAEIAGRATLATSLLDGRLAAGISAGMIWVAIAETGRAAAIFDAGIRLRPREDLALGAALRNAGPRLDGARLAAADLPTEVRAGVSYDVQALPVAGVHVVTHADVVAPLNDGRAGFAVGLEATLPTRAGGPRAALRTGYDGSRGTGGLGVLHIGAGLAFDQIDLDYAFQSLDVLGAVHRFGVRWSR
jgi:hypothetical protein